MREQKIICITCPIGCGMTVRGEGERIESIEGNQCKRGETYARDEFIHPVRILATLAKVEGAGCPLVAVRSGAPIPKELLRDSVGEIKKLTLKAPVKRGDVLIENILGTGVDIIATAAAT